MHIRVLRFDPMRGSSFYFMSGTDMTYMFVPNIPYIYGTYFINVKQDCSGARIIRLDDIKDVMSSCALGHYPGSVQGDPEWGIHRRKYRFKRRNW